MAGLKEVAPARLAATVPRRWWLFLLIVASLFLIGFYTVTDPERLAHNGLLQGADLAAYAICHRLGDHSFSLAGRQFPLCARCTGMYLGVFLAFVTFFLAGRGRWAALPPARILLLLLGFIALMGIDGINSYSHFFPEAPHLYQPRNWLRLATGLGTGLAMGTITVPALAQTIWREPLWRAPISTLRELAGLLFLAATLFLLLLSNQPAILYVLAIVSVAGVALILVSLNSMVVLLVSRREAQAGHWRDVSGVLLLALLMVLVEVALIDIVRYTLTGTMTGLPGL